jgi:uncharacterized protein
VALRRLRLLSFGVFLCAGLFVFGAADIKIPRAPDRWVTDDAGFLSPTTVQALDRKLENFEKESGHQIIVYITKTIEGYPIEDFAVKAFQAWKVGRQGLDDGLILFIVAEDRRARIEVGYGLEGVLPDITAGRIVNDILVPKIQAGDANAAVGDAVTAIIETISGPQAAPGQGPETPAFGWKGNLTAKTIFIIIGIILFLILFITHPSLAMWLLINILSGGGGGGRGGGGFGGGGGFRGGGGRSGGGGASGSW